MCRPSNMGLIWKKGKIFLHKKEMEVACDRQPDVKTSNTLTPPAQDTQTTVLLFES